MEMKIIIHGATNGSNFGDCLFAHLFYEAFSEYGIVDFLHMPIFGICDYLTREIPFYKSAIVNYKDADCLIYMSGGYFGDTEGNWKEALTRYFRYFRIAKYFIKSNKPIYVCGIGGGPVKNSFLRKTIVRILNEAKFVSVRDEETAAYFRDHGVVNSIIVTTDSALSIKNRKLPKFELCKTTVAKKNLFFHVYGDDKNNQELILKILPALNRFIDEHPNEYRVFVGTDYVCKSKICELEIYKNLDGDKVAVDYLSTWNFCSLIQQMNSVITVKLHVGIVSSLYGKSVISFPKHANKTKRFYKQIGYSDRCKLLKDCDENEIYSMINRYIDIPIEIDSTIIEKARCNLHPF